MHAVADQVVMQAVAAKDSRLPQVTKFRIADRPGRVAMVHRVSSRTGWVRRFHDHVATEIGDLAAIGTLTGMVMGQRLVEDQLGSDDGLDGSFFRRGTVARALAERFLDLV